MKIDKHQEQGRLELSLGGRLDTITAPELEAELNTIGDGIRELVLDFTDLSYLSSAGLRVILAAQKMMAKSSGSMVVRNVPEPVMEVFEITGFKEILTFA